MFRTFVASGLLVALLIVLSLVVTTYSCFQVSIVSKVIDLPFADGAAAAAALVATRNAAANEFSTALLGDVGIKPIEAFTAWPTRSYMHFDSLLRANASALRTCVYRPLFTEASVIFTEVWKLVEAGGPSASQDWAALEPFDASAPWSCEPEDVQWLVKCAACTAEQDRNACDWAAAETRRCGALRAYIPPVHYGAAPAPELERCLHDHAVVTVGDCNVRSLMAFALDALDRSAPRGRQSGGTTFY